MYFLTKVQHYNERMGSVQTNYALVCANNFADAIQKIVNDWGESSITALSLGPIELDERTLELDKEEFEMLWKPRGDGTL